MKICPVGAEFFYADRRTDGWTDRHYEAFHNFAKAPKNTGSTAKDLDSKIVQGQLR